MKKIGVFEMAWKGMSVWDREAFNSAASAIEAAELSQRFTNEQMTTRLRSLFELDEAQGEEIARLRCVIEVLCKMLLDAGVIDDTVFGHRIEAAIEEEELEKTEALAAEQARRERAALAEADRRRVAAEGVERATTCASCGKQVPARDTELTAEGAVCYACFNRVDG